MALLLALVVAFPEEKVYELKQRLKQLSQAWDSQTMGFLTHLDHVFMGFLTKNSDRPNVVQMNEWTNTSRTVVCRKEVGLYSYMPHAFWQ